MSVLVAYAHTVEGQAALQHGQDIAEREQLPLVVFDLDASSTADDRSTLPHHHPEDQVPAAGQSTPRWMARHHLNPDAAGELLDAAQELDARLIVVGVRPRSAVGKFLLGSNAQQIILGSPVPVLAVKAVRHAL